MNRDELQNKIGRIFVTLKGDVRMIADGTESALIGKGTPMYPIPDARVEKAQEELLALFAQQRNEVLDDIYKEYLKQGELLNEPVLDKIIAELKKGVRDDMQESKVL